MTKYIKVKQWEPPPNFVKHKNSCSNHQKNSRITQQIEKAVRMDKLEDDLNALQEIIKVFENLLASSSLFVLFDKMLGRHICLA